ncbi:MAG: hypothetical protein FIA94_00860 [Nitrospirae bacterium]|nr:hypothetical protein [Nitrospirota bacterium]
MRHARIFLIIVLTMISVTACAADKEDLQVKKQPELQQIKPKKPVKIKLRRSPKDEYTWELSGDDADEIVKTDRKLRKMLNVP